MYVCINLLFQHAKKHHGQPEPGQNQQRGAGVQQRLVVVDGGIVFVLQHARRQDERDADAYDDELGRERDVEG